MKTLAAAMVGVVLAGAMILATESPAMAAAKPVTVTVKAATVKALVPAAAPALAKCPILAAGKPITITLNAATIKSYLPALANLKFFTSGKAVLLTIMP